MDTKKLYLSILLIYLPKQHPQHHKQAKWEDNTRMNQRRMGVVGAGEVVLGLQGSRGLQCPHEEENLIHTWIAFFNLIN